MSGAPSGADWWGRLSAAQSENAAFYAWRERAERDVRQRDPKYARLAVSVGFVLFARARLRRAHDLRMIELCRYEMAKRGLPAPLPVPARARHEALPLEYGQWTWEYRHGYCAGFSAGRSFGRRLHAFPHPDPSDNPLSARLGGHRRAAWARGYREGWVAGHKRAKLPE